MKVAYPGWGASQPVVVGVAPQQGEGVQQIRLMPRLVLAPDPQRRFLVLEGLPIDEHGEAFTGHVWAASLGYVGFARRDGRWTLSNKVESFAWSGEWGRAGELSAIKWVEGQAVLSVANPGQCAQGFCHDGLALFHFTDRGATKVLALLTADDSQGYTGPCNEVLDELARVVSDPEKYDAGLPFACWKVTSDVRIHANVKGAWPDIEFRFKGQRVNIDREKFVATTEDKTGTVRFSFNGWRYVVASGKSPLQPDLQ